MDYQLVSEFHRQPAELKLGDMAMICSSNRVEPWHTLVCLLEEFELRKEKPEKRSNWKVVVGLLLALIGTGGTVATLVLFSGDNSGSTWPLAFYGAFVFFIPGILLIASGLSSKAFEEINRGVQRAVNGWITVAQVALVMISLIVTAIFVDMHYFSAGVSEETHLASYITYYSIVALIACLILITGMGPIDFGLINPRSGLRAKQRSIYCEIASLAVLVFISVAWVGWGTAGIALALSSLTALVAYMKYRHSRLDEAFSEAISKFDEIRSAAIADIKQINRRSSHVFVPTIYAKYRELHLRIVASPVIDRRKYKGFGLTALCQISDMRNLGESDSRKYIRGCDRIHYSDRCIALSDYDFAVGTAQVFDALIRMLDGSFAPQSVRRKDNRELRKCLEFHAVSRSSLVRDHYLLSAR